MEGITRVPFSVRATDCDIRSGLRMDALFIQMQEVAEQNAAAYGAGHNALLAKGLFFALASASVRLTRPPRFGEQLIICTWPGVSNRFFYPRYHTLQTADGERIADTASLWVTLSPESRAVVPPAKAALAFPDTSAIPAPLPLPTRMPAFPEDGIEETMRIPMYSDHDLNGHVNNTRYLAWLADTLDDVLKERFIAEVTVSYEKEIRGSAPCRLQLSLAGDDFHFRILSEGGERHFSAFGRLQSRE